MSSPSKFDAVIVRGGSMDHGRGVKWQLTGCRNREMEELVLHILNVVARVLLCMLLGFGLAQFDLPFGDKIVATSWMRLNSAMSVGINPVR